MQVCHQRMSSITAGLKGEGVSKSSSLLAASKSRLQKVLPGATTFAANESVPTKDSSSLLVQFLRVNQPSSDAFRSDSLSAGSRISHFTESSSMPKKSYTSGWGHTLSGPLAMGDVKVFQGCKQSEEFVLGRGEGLCWLNREIIVEIVYQIFHPKFVCRNPAKGTRQHIKQKRGGAEAKWQDLINVVLPLPVNTQQRPVSRGYRAEAKGVLQINFGKPCPFPMFMHQTYSIIHSYVVKGKLIFGNTIINTESLGADKCMIRRSLPDFLGTRPIPEQRSEGWGREG